MTTDHHAARLFARWFWLVYLPLGLLLASLLLLASGVFPKGAWPALVLLAGYGVLATRLLLERRKRGLGVPAPRSIIIGIGSVAIVLLFGSMLFAVGMDRLSTDQGLVLAAAGGFLMILSVTVPAFRIVDVFARWLGKLFTKRAGTKDPLPERTERS